MPNIKHAIMWSYEVWSELDAQIVNNHWRMAHILLATWNVDFALVEEREKNRMQKESDELGALISKLQLDDDEMSIKTYIQMETEEIIELELSSDELADASLGTNYTQDFDPNVDLALVGVDDVAPPTIKLNDAKRHASLLSSFILENSYVLMLMKLLIFKS